MPTSPRQLRRVAHEPHTIAVKVCRHFSYGHFCGGPYTCPCPVIAAEIGHGHGHVYERELDALARRFDQD